MDNLILLSGNDIPFPECQTAVHQPTIREIAYIGEETFFTGCEILNFSKNLLAEEDKKDLEDKTVILGCGDNEEDLETLKNHLTEECKVKDVYR